MTSSTMPKFEPVATVVDDFDGWTKVRKHVPMPGGTKLFTEAYEAGKRDAIPLKETLVDLINEHVGDALFCERVWSAWQVGTMSEDDFTPVSECSNPSDLADAIISMLVAAPKGEE